MTAESGKRNAARVIVPIAVFILAAVLVLWLCQLLLVPKYMSFPVEGALVGEYYKSAPDHDVVFFGDCEFYECINPVVLWREYGINSYVRGSSQQLIWDSYYMLLETLERETPDVVVFNAVEMKIGEVQKEEYTRLTLDGMKLSKYKLAAAKESLTEGESLLSYVFPIIRYHSRWSDLGADDFRYMFKRDPVSYNGYLLMTGVKAKNTSIKPPSRSDYSFPDICWDYLEKMRTACEEKGITFIILKAPTNTWHYPWYSQWEDQMVKYAEEKNVRYISAVALDAEIGMDWSTDSCDGGDHLNYIGAERVSEYIGRILADEYGIPDRRTDGKLSEEWQKICGRYDKALAAATETENK